MTNDNRRYPGKNLMPLAGRPMLAYSILLARSIPEVDCTIVASDGESILNAGSKYGAFSSQLPSNLTGDNAKLIGSLKYVLDAYENVTKWAVPCDWVVLFQPNCPLRLLDQIRGWLQDVLALGPYKCDGLLTVDSGTYKLGHHDLQGFYVPDYDPGILKQHVQPRYRENGLVYILKADNIRKGILFGPRMLTRECRREQSLANIDYDWDYQFTVWAYDHFGYRSEFDRLEEQLGITCY